MALKVGELFAEFNLDTSGLSSAVSSAESKLSSLGKGLAIGGAGMTAAVTVPIANAAKAIYAAGTEFDAEMSKVFAIAGDSVTGNAEIMEALRNKALEMGSTTQFTATEAGQAMEYMAMAGWKSEQMLAAIEPMMNLAAAAGADLGTTSDIITDAMTAFGYAATDTVKVVKDGVEMEVNAVEHFADVLAAASSNSNTNVTMLGESFKFAAPLAGAFGYNVDDVAIALGLMANNGIKSSMAGTSLSRIIQNMTKPSKQTTEAMDALGLSLYNSRGEIKPLRELMGDFREEAKKNGVNVQEMAGKVADLDEQFQSGKITEDQYEKQLEKITAGGGDFLKNITQIAGARGLPGLLAIMNATDEDFEKLCAAIDNATGSAEEMKRVMLDNAKGDVTILKSALEGLQITLWGLAEDGFRKVIQRATGLVDAFRNASKSTQLGTLKMAALAAAIGPVMTGLGGLIALLPKLANLFTLVSGPAAFLAIGMLALGAAAIDSNNDIGKTFVKGMSAAGSKVREFGETVKAQLPTLTQNMGNFLNSVSTGIEQGIPGIMDGISDVLTTAISAISGNAENIAHVSQTLVTTLAEGVKRNAPKIIPAAAELITNMATALAGNIPTLVTAFGTVMDGLAEGIGNIDGTEMGTKIGSVAAQIISSIAKALPKAIDSAGNVINAGLTLGAQLLTSIAEAFEGNGLDANIQGIVESLIDNIVKVLGGVINFGSKALSAGAKIATAIMESISTALVNAESSGMAQTLGTALSDIVKGLFNAVTDFATDPNVLDFVKNLGNGIKAALGTIGQLLGSFIGDLLKYLFSEEGLTRMFNAGAAVMNLLWEGMKSVAGGIVGFFTNLVDEILISWGVIDVDAKETYEAAEAAAKSSLEVAKKAFNDALASYDADAGTNDTDFQNMALLALFGARNGSMGDIVDASNEWASDFIQLAEEAINASLGEGPHVSLEQWAGNMWADLESAVQGTGEGRTISTETVRGILEQYLTPLGIEAASLSDEIIASISENITKGGLEKGNELWSLILSSILGETGTVDTQGVTDPAKAAVEEAMEEIGIATQKAAEETKEGVESIGKKLDDGANSMAVSEFVTTVKEGMGEAQAAVAESANAISNEVLLTLSAENGSMMATGFLGGIISAFGNGTAVSAAGAMATQAMARAQSVLSNGAGYRIGHNFAQGLVNGINAMIETVKNAAAALGSAAAGALSGAIKEGSPSRLTAEIGTNFGLGFINAIQSSAAAAGNAAKMVGLAASGSLADSVNEIRSTAADQMSLNDRNSVTDTRTAENERNAMTIGALIANALNGAQVVMDGTVVGHLISGTVSEDIADRYAGMRYGTV